MATPAGEYRSDLNRGLSESLSLARLFDSLADHQLNWRPNEGGWSIGQCLDHLLLANRHYLSFMGAAVEAAKGHPSEGPIYQSGLLGRLLIRAVGPESTMNVPVPRQIEPTTKPVTTDIVAQFEENTSDLIALLESTEGLDLARVKIRSPFAKWMRFSLGDAFKIIEVHNKRHLLQAERIIQTPGFPTYKPSAHMGVGVK